MYNDPNQQPPYGQEPQQPGELPPTQYAPQPPYGQQPPPPYEPPPYGQQPQQPGELPPTQYAPQPQAYQAQQPPYGQPPQPPPYGQPAYGAPAPGMVPGYAPPPQQKKSLKWLWITLGVVAGVLILSCGACVSLGLYNTISGPRSAAQDYFKAVENQNYTTAFGYFAQGATLTDTDTGQKIPISPQSAYVSVSNSLDLKYGALTDYQLNSGSDNNHLTATLTRQKQTQTYTIHLQMTQINNEWKILNVDGF